MSDATVSLRPLVMRDVPRLVEICNQMQVGRYLAHMPHPFKRSHAKRFVTFGMENPGLVFGIAFDRLLVGALQMRDQLEYFLDPIIGGKVLQHVLSGKRLIGFFPLRCSNKLNLDILFRIKPAGEC